MEGRSGVQRAGPGAEGSSALLWGSRQGSGKGDSPLKPSLPSSHLPFTACLLGTPLMTLRAWFAAMLLSKFLTKQIFREKILIHWHQDVLTSNALVSQQLICLGIRIPTVPDSCGQFQVTHNSLCARDSSAGVPNPQPQALRFWSSVLPSEETEIEEQCRSGLICLNVFQKLQLRRNPISFQVRAHKSTSLKYPRVPIPEVK